MSNSGSNGQDGVAASVARSAKRRPAVVALRPLPAARGRATAAPVRAVIPFSQNWRFSRCETEDDAQAITWGADGSVPALSVENWETVHLPHSVRLEPRNASGCRNYQGVCWYQKQFVIPESYRDRIIYLEFEAAMQSAEVWLNDHLIGAHACGYTPFVIDISRWAHFGAKENFLIVRLDNSDNPQLPPGKPQRELDFTYFGGMYRNVWLKFLDRLHITDEILADEPGGGGVFVTYPHVAADYATVRVQTDVQNEHNQPRRFVLRQQLLDAAGAVVASCADDHELAAGAARHFSQSLQVSNPRLWHPHHPHLYFLRTTVAADDNDVDERTTRIGIRHIRFDKDDGLFINNDKFFSLGANRHQDHAYVGYALPDSAHRRDVRKLREAGFSSFRSHYPQANAFMDACDELGMLTIVSNPGWQFVGDDVFKQRAVHNARTMVRRDRNRPSVILWEAALNESDNSSLAAALQQAVHEEYPGDQCFTAGDREGNTNHPPTASWDVEYLHNDGSKPYWIREWGDQVDNWRDQQSSSRVARRYGESAMLIQAASHLARLNDLFVGHSGSSSGLSGQRLAGACLWAAIDHHRGYHLDPFQGGVLDLFRLPKFDHYLFQSQRPPDVHVPGLDDGPMVFIANLATFFSPTTITVFSNCEEVRLLRDGRQIARQKPDAGYRIAHPPFTFQIGRLLEQRSTMYMTGTDNSGAAPLELRAEGIIDGHVVATHVVRPPGKATRLHLEADLCGHHLAADGADWVRIYCRVCDAHGTVCPLNDDLITFSVDGPAQIIGHSEGHKDLAAERVCAEAGIATTLIQAATHAGKISIKASAFGLAAGQLQIVSQPSRPIAIALDV
jgi:beta-galactosidase